MKNMEKLGIFFSVLLICVTLFSVIQTGPSNPQNIPQIPVNQTYPTPTIVPKTITQTTTTPISIVNSNIPNTLPDFDEILRNSEWKGKNRYGGSYDLRIINGSFYQESFRHGIRCPQEGKLTFYYGRVNYWGPYDAINYTFYKNSCNMGTEDLPIENIVTWLSKDSFVLRWEGEDSVTYTRKYPN